MNLSVFEQYNQPEEPTYSNQEEHRNIYICKLKPQFAFNKHCNQQRKIVIKTFTVTKQELKQKKWQKELSNIVLEKNKLFKI